MTGNRTRIFVIALCVTVLVLGGVVIFETTRRDSRAGDEPGAALATSATTSPDQASPVPPSPTRTERQNTAGRARASARAQKRSQKPANPSVATPPPPRATNRTARYVYPIGRCTASYSSAHHDYPAADMFARRGCPFVAPVDGRVDEVGRTDHWSSTRNDGRTRGGRFVSLIGVDGVRYYGAHLTKVLNGVVPGTRVAAGQTLGLIGESGSARGTGAHLHFGISWATPAGQWWIRRGAVPPQPFLNAWRTGRQRSPVAAVATARRSYGDDSRCASYC